MEQQTFTWSKFQRVEREDRLNQIAEIVIRAGTPLTLLQVARRIGLRKSNHVRGMLEELVEEGTLKHGPVVRQPNGNHAITYRPDYLR